MNVGQNMCHLTNKSKDAHFPPHPPPLHNDTHGQILLLSLPLTSSHPPPPPPLCAQGIRHMWGATDLAYIMWLIMRKPGVPFFVQMRIFATVTDVHISSAASAFLSTFAMPLLALLRPGYFGTPLGHTLLVSHEYAIVFLIFITIVTGAVYEWYAAEMVSACKPKFIAADYESGLEVAGGGGG